MFNFVAEDSKPTVFFSFQRTTIPRVSWWLLSFPNQVYLVFQPLTYYKFDMYQVVS